MGRPVVAWSLTLLLLLSTTKARPLPTGDKPSFPQSEWAKAGSWLRLALPDPDASPSFASPSPRSPSDHAGQPRSSSPEQASVPADAFHSLLPGGHPTRASTPRESVECLALRECIEALRPQRVGENHAFKTLAERRAALVRSVDVVTRQDLWQLQDRERDQAAGLFRAMRPLLARKNKEPADRVPFEQKQALLKLRDWTKKNVLASHASELRRDIDALRRRPTEPGQVPSDLRDKMLSAEALRWKMNRKGQTHVVNRILPPDGGYFPPRKQLARGNRGPEGAAEQAQNAEARQAQEAEAEHGAPLPARSGRSADVAGPSSPS